MKRTARQAARLGSEGVLGTIWWSLNSKNCIVALLSHLEDQLAYCVHFILSFSKESLPPRPGRGKCFNRVWLSMASRIRFDLTNILFSIFLPGIYTPLPHLLANPSIRLDTTDPLLVPRSIRATSSPSFHPSVRDVADANLKNASMTTYPPVIDMPSDGQADTSKSTVRSSGRRRDWLPDVIETGIFD
jgi:hypothetical protein